VGQLSKLATTALLLALLACAPAVAAGPPRRVAVATSHHHAVKTHRRAPGCPTLSRRSRRRACRAALRHRRLHAHSSAPKPTTNATSSAQAAAQSTSLAVAAALAAPCPNTQITPEEGNIELAREAVLCLVNQERAQHGIAPLRLSHQLEVAAEGHCGELIADDYFAHVSPTGETPVERIRTTGYIPGPPAGYVIGENLAWGTYGLATPQAIVSAWIASPEHLANILEAEYSETGIGISPAVPSSLAPGATGATYAQEFGAIVR
jgi:uncharacterized protein YkwD